MKNVVASTSLSYKGNFQLVSIFCLASICGAAASAEENSLYSEISDDTLYELLLAEFTTGDGETDPQSDRYTDLPVEEQVVEEPLFEFFTEALIEEILVGTI